MQRLVPTLESLTRVVLHFKFAHDMRVALRSPWYLRFGVVYDFRGRFRKSGYRVPPTFPPVEDAAFGPF